MSAIFIVAGKRTPFGSFGGSLKHLSPTQLAAHAAKAALAAINLPASAVDTCVVGNVAQTNSDAPYLARHVALEAGADVATPCLTVNRLCGSGFQSLVSVAQEMLTDKTIQIGIAGGAESMSSAPFVARGIRWGIKLGNNPPLTDSLWECLTDERAKMPMAMTAEKLAQQYQITREDADKYGARSQALWKAAHESGAFKAEMAGIELKIKGKQVLFEIDEHARPDATYEAMAKLPSLFIPKTGTVTAGNASGIADGGAALILATEEAVKKHNLTPLARLIGWHSAGVDPSIMGFGPVPAIRGVLKKTNLQLSDIDRFEINEAFAVQYLACERELGLDRARVNIHGGAIAMGHPTGASGGRIMTHLAHEIAATPSMKYAIGSACIGGGQGIALVLQRV